MGSIIYPSGFQSVIPGPTTSISLWTWSVNSQVLIPDFWVWSPITHFEVIQMQLVCWCYCDPVTKSCLTLCRVSMDCNTPDFPVLHYFLEFSQTRVYWVEDAIQPISSSVIPSSSCPQSFPVSGCFSVSQLFASSGQSIGVSVSVLPVDNQGWFPLGLTGLISLISKGLSRVFSNTTVQKHQFFGIQPSLWSSPHICTWVLEKPIALTIWTFVNKLMSLLYNTLFRFAASLRNAS